jgi:hypothetical protein
MVFALALIPAASLDAAVCGWLVSAVDLLALQRAFLAGARAASPLRDRFPGGQSEKGH